MDGQQEASPVPGATIHAASVREDGTRASEGLEKFYTVGGSYVDG